MNSMNVKDLIRLEWLGKSMKSSNYKSVYYVSLLLTHLTARIKERYHEQP